jgi:hypothetical protein
MGDVYENTVGEVTGQNKSSEAAGRAAQAQESAMQRGVGFAQDGLAAGQIAGQNAVGAANKSAAQMIRAAQSPEELRALRQSLQQQSQAITRQSALFNSIDPAIMEASQQAFKLLQGGDSAQSTAVAKRRKREREKLLANLRSQLGPGAETSTAGMQALNQFDSETESLQQANIGQLFGMASSGAANRSQLNQGTGQLANIGSAFGNAAGRVSNAMGNAGQMRVNANLGAGQLEQGGFSNLINAQQGLAGASGSQFVSDQLKGQAQSQFINEGIQMNAEMGSSAMGSMSSACCFIMLEARYGNGTMDEVVRRFRDEAMTDQNRRGYYKVAEVLVPLMRKSKVIKFLVRVTMTTPLVAYGKYYYGQNKWGKLMRPVKEFWLGLFNYLGDDHEFIRENGEIV